MIARTSPAVRTSITLPGHLAELLQMEAKRRHLPVSAVIREALEAYFQLAPDGSRILPFESLGCSGEPDIAGRIDEILAKEWADAILRDS